MRTQRARSKPCVLVQPSPAVSRVASVSRLDQSRRRTAPDLYGIGVRITHIDRAIIRAYLEEYGSALTNGKAREEIRGQDPDREWLPNSTLSSAAQTQLLPPALECKLSALPAGFERVMADHDVLLVATATREIVDVMCNACASGGRAKHRAARESRPALTIIRPGTRRDAAAKWRLFERNCIF